MKLQEIKRAISNLNPDELSHFRRWFEEFGAEAWDEQFERDAKSGKLDKFADKAIADFHLRGKYKGKGLMKALMAEKKRERNL